MATSAFNLLNPTYLGGTSGQSHAYAWPGSRDLPELVQTVGVTPSLNAAPWLVDAMNGLKRLATLHPDWDSYGSPAVTAAALCNARVLLSAITAESIPDPEIAPVPGGGVSIEWQAGQRELEVEVLPDGTVEFLRVSGKDLDAPGAVREGRINNPSAVPINLLVTWVTAG